MRLSNEQNKNKKKKPNKKIITMITIEINHGGHDWQKKNLVTLSGRKGSYDIMKCSKCGIEGKRRTFNTITLKASYNLEKINNCNGVHDIPQKIQITICGGFGKQFSNLTPNSIHDVVEPPAPYKNDSSGVWVMGVGEPVKVLHNEFKKVPQ